MVSHKAAQRPYAPLWTASSHGFELCFGQRADETQHKSTLMLLRKREDEINVLRADLERAQAELHRRSAVRLCMLHQTWLATGICSQGFEEQDKLSNELVTQRQEASRLKEMVFHDALSFLAGDHRTPASFLCLVRVSFHCMCVGVKWITISCNHCFP